jgi:hypothetical protein
MLIDIMININRLIEFVRCDQRLREIKVTKSSLTGAVAANVEEQRSVTRRSNAGGGAAARRERYGPPGGRETFITCEGEGRKVAVNKVERPREAKRRRQL